MLVRFICNLIIFLSLCSFSSLADRSSAFNLENGLAIQGYDPVAYFTQGKAVKGYSKYAVKADGVTYWCSDSKNKELLLKNYTAYEPQYGGWCAYAMGNSGEKVEIDPETFKILNGKLYLFYNAYFTNTLKLWNKNETVLRNKADINWKKIFK